MNKIYLSGNYVIVEKDGNVYEYPRTLSVYTLEGSNYVIKERIDDGQFVIPISQIGTYFDETGAVAYDEASLVAFLRTNTGFKTAGGGSPADADAQLFIDAASITDSTQQSAINQLVIDLKNYGIWTKMKALYPFVGGTASTHKWNLKDPRDLDAAFRLVFNGGGTHSSNGYLPNGINAYADTKLIPSAAIFGTNQNIHLSHYSRTYTAGGYEFGNSYDGQGNSFGLIQSFRTNNNIYAMFKTVANIAVPTGLGFAIANSTSAGVKAIKNGAVLATKGVASVNFALFTGSTYLAADNRLGTAIEFSTKECAFASIGEGLTDTEAADFYTAVQAFNTTLSRQV